MFLFICFTDRLLCFTVCFCRGATQDNRNWTDDVRKCKTPSMLVCSLHQTANIWQFISVWSGIRVCSTSNYQIICLSSCSCNRCYSDKRGLVSCDSWIWWPNDFPYNKIYNIENENWAAGEVNEKFKNCNKKKVGKTCWREQETYYCQLQQGSNCWFSTQFNLTLFIMHLNHVKIIIIIIRRRSRRRIRIRTITIAIFLLLVLIRSTHGYKNTTTGFRRNNKHKKFV